MKIAFIFPGQGAQYVGMGKAMAEMYPLARETFEQADEALSFSIRNLMFSGPNETLRITYYTQPAILAVSIACLRVFNAQSRLQPAFVAGHSLGEYTALVAAGSLSFEDALRLVHLRGRLMDEAVPAGKGAMAAVLGADQVKLQALCEEITASLGQSVEIANVNCPGQSVVSGAVAAVLALIARAAEAKARRAIRLDVSGPFHSSLMAPAGDKLETHLMAQSMADPVCPVVANVSALPLRDVHLIKKALAQQVASPVLWEASVETMIAGGANAFVEFGPGAVLSGLIKKIDKEVLTLHAEDPKTLQTTLYALGEGVSA